MREIQRHHHAFDYLKNPSATSADPFCSRTLLLFVCNLAVLINLKFLSAVAGDGVLARRSILVDVFPCDLIILFRMTLLLMRCLYYRTESVHGRKYERGCVVSPVFFSSKSKAEEVREREPLDTLHACGRTDGRTLWRQASRVRF
jgi:hypothetical protein